jgi:hypothetical protein
LLKHASKRLFRRETLASLLRKVGQGIQLSEHLDPTNGETICGSLAGCGTGAAGLDGRPAVSVDSPSARSTIM